MRKLFSKIFTVLMLFSLVSLLMFSSCKKTVIPIAGFVYDTESEIPFGIPLKVYFTNSSNDLIEGSTYSWDFGDNLGVSTEKDPIYTFAKGGTYTVSLTVSNDDATNVYQENILLTNQLVGTWKLDSAAICTIDTMNVLGGIEFGNRAGWDGLRWTEVGDNGYSTIWSNLIFSGNYFGRKMFFSNEFTFSADGTFKRKLVEDLFVFYAGEQILSESVDWVSSEGVSLNGYKSYDNMSWNMQTNPENDQTSVIELTGSSEVVPWLGFYLAGNTEIVGSEYTYVVSKVNNDQLIVSGLSNLFPPDNVFVLKFRRAQ